MSRNKPATIRLDGRISELVYGGVLKYKVVYIVLSIRNIKLLKEQLYPNNTYQTIDVNHFPRCSAHLDYKELPLSKVK